MNPERNMTRIKRGFTLIELMVSIAVIALLVTLVAVSLKTMRGSAQRTVSLSALKQIMLAYRSYSDDNRGQLMPGYIGEDLLDDETDPFGKLTVRLPLGDPDTDPWIELEDADVQSYVWRLAPYVDYVWTTFYTEMKDKGLTAQLEGEYYIDGIFGPFGGNSVIEGGISERPSFGLNSIFVGGDSVHGGTYATDRHPWTGDPDVVPLAATRFTQVKNPARLIVFGAAAKADDGGSTQVYADQLLGFCELRPPYLEIGGNKWIDPQWQVGKRGLLEQTDTGFYDETGLPIVRSGNDVIPVGMLDGSTAQEQLSNLSRDMRRWNPFEVALRETQGP